MSKHPSGSSLNMEQFMRSAVDFEIDSAAFYRSMQQDGLEDEVPELLKGLAAFEGEHERRLRRLRKA